MNEQEIFLQAIELAPDARPAFLERACAGNVELLASVAALLRAHEGASRFLDSPPSADPGKSSPSITIGTMIGPYRLVEQIGEGGMGTVFRAEQMQPVRRTVALKIIKAGMDSRQIVARFEAERQALAMMDHPNIAKVFDAGVTEQGRPYFVMEYVDGRPITQFCDGSRFTIDQRLELFISVCNAIQHAHQKGIIHRDIKPSNVLIALYDGRPVPKVIDFGVAKATEQRAEDLLFSTQFGAVIGTLEYMSPEQAERSPKGIDTRSDVYSLGVLLYELLTGVTPIGRERLANASYAELLQFIKDIDPPAPSTRLANSGEHLASISAVRSVEPKKLSKRIRGELDWIVMKCLEKNRERRYASANELAGDLSRYLADEPVSAGAPSRLYRLRKLVRRNRAAFTAGGFSAVMLIVCTAVSVFYARDAIAARKQSERDLESAKRLGGELAIKNDQLTRQAFLDHLQSAEQLLLLDQPSQANERIKKARLARGKDQKASLAGRLLQRRSGVEERTVLLAGGIVMSAAFSPDGSEIAAITAEGVLRRWNSETGKLINEYSLNKIFDLSTPIVYSENGSFIACNGAPGSNEPGHMFVVDINANIIYRWDLIDRPGVRSLKLTQSFKGIEELVTGDSHAAVDVKRGASVPRKNFAEFERSFRKSATIDGASAVREAVDSQSGITAVADREEVKFRSKANGKFYASIPVANGRNALGVSFSKNGRTVFVSTEEGYVQELPVVMPPKFIRNPSAKKSRDWSGGRTSSQHLRVTVKDGSLIFSETPSNRALGWVLAPAEGIIEIKATESWRSMTIITREGEYTYDLAWLLGGRALVSLEGGRAAALAVHKGRGDLLTFGGQEIHVWRWHDDHPDHIELAPPANFMVPLDNRGAVLTGASTDSWLRRGELVRPGPDSDPSPTTSLPISQFVQKPLALNRDRKRIREFEIENAIGGRLDKPSGRLILLCDQEIVAVDQVTGAIGWRASTELNYYQTLDLSPDGRFAVVGDSKSGIRPIRLDNGHPIELPAIAKEGIPHRFARAVKFSRDGSRLFAIIQATVYVFDVTTWNVLSKHSLFHFPHVIALSPTEDLIALGSSNMSAQVYRLPDFNHLAELPTRGSTGLAFSPDGSVLAVGEREGRTSLWDAKGWNRLSSYNDGGEAKVTGLEFIDDGNALLILHNDDGRAHRGLVRWRLTNDP